MNPRRLLAFLAVFVVISAAYFLLTWREARQEKAEQDAKRLYHFKVTAITSLSLKRGAEVINLEKKERDWQITSPVKTMADQNIVGAVLDTLASLSMERSVGQEKDLHPFGLKEPALVVNFMADGKSHRLDIGNPVPGNRGFYAVKDQGKDVVILSAADKQSLDRPLTALRDKTLLSFSPDKVKALKIHVGSQKVNLHKIDNTWKLQGQDQFRVRADRLDSLLRRLDTAQIKDFVSESPGPKDLKTYGLVPTPKGEVTVAEDQRTQTILLGEAAKEGVYARKDGTGPVFLVNERLKKDLEQTIAGLEELRLWPGKIAEVQKVAWGPPNKTWTAVKKDGSFNLTGPGKESLTQPAVRLEMSLAKFQDLEYTRLVPAAEPAKPAKYLLELHDASGKLLLRLAETGKREKDKVEVSLERQDKTELALVPAKPYQAWQEDMDRLTRKPGE
ncbi:MAG: DUF4340 domain-containing protein [Deltaproteobacteria bacterium]|nr:DUF4340 domain-containing protein [Deltaproteobacteria bacterium]